MGSAGSAERDAAEESGPGLPRGADFRAAELSAEVRDVLSAAELFRSLPPRSAQEQRSYTRAKLLESRREQRSSSQHRAQGVCMDGPSTPERVFSFHLDAAILKTLQGLA